MSFLSFTPYIIALAIAAAIPGPGITASVGTALGSGFRSGLYFVTGLVCGDLFYLSLAVAGLTAIAGSFAEIFVVIRWAGAAYLCYLAWGFWRGGVDPEKVAARKANRGPLATAFAGWSVTLGNPKTIIFYMALLPTVVDLGSVTLQSYVVLVVLTILVLYSVCIPYVALASSARRFLINPRALRWMGRGAGAAMAGAAAFIVLRE